MSTVRKEHELRSAVTENAEAAISSLVGEIAGRPEGGAKERQAQFRSHRNEPMAVIAN